MVIATYTMVTTLLGLGDTSTMAGVQYLYKHGTENLLIRRLRAHVQDT